MANYTPEDLEKLKEWVESFKGQQMSSVDDALEAQRQAQGAAELVSRGEKAAGRSLGTLGELAKGAESMRTAPTVSPAQASARVFEEANTILPKSLAENIVRNQSMPGKSAKQSANVIQEAGSSLDKKLAQRIVEAESKLGKTAAESASFFEKANMIPSKSAELSADVLAPKELPTVSNYATPREKKLFGALLKQAQSEMGAAGETVVEAADQNAPKNLPATISKNLPATVDDVIETTGRTISDAPVSKSKLAALLGKTAKPFAALSAAKDVYDVQSSLKEGDYRQAAEQAGSALGGIGGGALGSAAGPAGTLGGSVAGSYMGGKAAGALYDIGGDYLTDSEKGSLDVDSFLLMPQTVKKREQERKMNEDIRKVEGSRDAAKSSKELLSYKRPESVEKQEQFLKNKDDQLADFIASAESGRDYTAVNKKSGAFGKYQILEKDENGKDVHGKAVEKRYGMPFKEAMSDPAKQEEYFRNVLLPQYKKDAAKLVQHPMAKALGLDEFTLVGMLQLGKGHVKDVLDLKANDNIRKQFFYFRKKADQYKREIAAEQADLAGLKNKEAQWQEEGKYIPFKSAQAKMDTLRSGETTMTREDVDALNDISRMRQEDEMRKSGSYIPFKSTEDKMRTLDEQQAVADGKVSQAKLPEAAVTEQAKSLEVAADKPKSRLEEALELQRQYEMLAAISRGSERLGRGLAGAISGVAPSKMSAGEFEEGLTRIGKQGVEGAKLLEEAQKEKDSADPSSEVSKKARNAYKKAYSALGIEVDIPDTLSADDIKITKFSDLAKSSDKQKGAETEKETKLLTDAGKEIRKRSESVVKIMDLQKRAKDALKSPNAAKDIETLYGFIKSLDENSAVREGELKLAEGTLSRLSFYKNKLQGLVGSKRTLDDETLSNISKIMDEVSSQTQSNYGNYKKSIFAPLADRGITAERYEALDPISYRTPTEPSTEKQLSTEKPPRLAKGKERQPGNTVSMGGVKYKVGADGRELIPVK
jgi:hypothetical protein